MRTEVDGSAEVTEQLQQVLGAHYTIERVLGHGGMAMVYLARDSKHGRRVALKVLHSALAANLGTERFRREIRLAASLHHPHILPVYDSGETSDGQLWFTMPYVEGQSLRDRLNRQAQLPLDDAVRIARELALAVDYAHRQGVIHRDVKPENILLVDGQAILADFGIARRLAVRPELDASMLTDTGIAVGTPTYMSPEQAAGDRRLDATTDIYALGAVLYEMLTGEPPFTGSAAQVIAAKMQADGPPSTRRTRPSVPEGVDSATRKALSPVPADRYATGAEFANALDSGHHAARAARLGPRSGRTLAIRAAMLGLGIAAATGAALAWRAHDRAAIVAKGPVRLAVLPFDNMGDSGDAYFADGITDAVRGKLTRLPGLEVIGSTSSSQYRRTAKTPQQIGRELRVRYILVGKVHWAKFAGPAAPPSRVRVSPELIDASNATDRWAEPFDAPLTDVFQVQADIAGQVAQQLRVALTPDSRHALAQRPTMSLDAYDAYLRGREVAELGDPLSQGSQGVFWFQQAVNRDSTFALAWAGLASMQAWHYQIDPTPARAESARVAAARALALAPDLPEAYSARANYFYRVHNDDSQALAAVQAGLRVYPNSAPLLGHAGLLERDLHHWDDALRLLERAAQIDPRDGIVATNLGQSYLDLRRYAEARTTLDLATSLRPTNLWTRQYRAMVELAQGDLPAAQAIIRATPATIDQRTLTVYLATYLDLIWVLDSAQQQLLLTLGPAAFGNSRGEWGIVMAQAYALRNDSVHMHAYADSARVAFEAQLRATPDVFELRLFHGLALAYLGRRGEAMAEGERDAARWQPRDSYTQHQLARIYILVGEPEKALDTLEPLIKTPYFLSPAWLRIDPNFAPLRGNPRFERLVRGTAPKERAG